MYRASRLLISVVLVSACSVVAVQAASTARLRLPSATGAIRARVRAEQQLRGGRGPERVLPGPVVDDEIVRVAVTPTGVPQRVTVDQRLHIADVGDYFVKIAGPVEGVEALPDSTAQPGLRSGSLVWQGFSSSSEMLGARVELDPENEAERLPVETRLQIRVDDASSDEGNGSMELEVEVVNTTGAPTVLPSADPVEPERAAGLLDSVARSLEAGERPGRGLPPSIPVEGPVATRPAQVVAPVSVGLEVMLDGSATDVEGRGIRVKADGTRTRVISSTILSGRRPRHVFRFSASAPEGRPIVRLRVSPSAPPASEARPSADRDWTSAYRRGSVTGREVLDRLVSVLAEVARLPEIDGYLGNPDRDGTAHTTYLYRFVTATAVEQTPAGSPDDAAGSLLGVAAAVALAALLLFGLVVWWAVS